VSKTAYVKSSIIIECILEPRGAQGLEGFRLGEKYRAVRIKKGYRLYYVESPKIGGDYLGFVRGRRSLDKYFKEVE